ASLRVIERTPTRIGAPSSSSARGSPWFTKIDRWIIRALASSGSFDGSYGDGGPSSKWANSPPRARSMADGARPRAASNPPSAQGLDRVFGRFGGHGGSFGGCVVGTAGAVSFEAACRATARVCDERHRREQDVALHVIVWAKHLEKRLVGAVDATRELAGKER